MKTVLLIVDLEGVGGVDSSRALSAASPAFAGARRLATDEVLAALGGLFGRGVERVRVSDSHRPGGSRPTIIAEELPPGAELIWTGDPYDAGLFDGVDAVACLGMHAAAGTPGFASHTVSVQCAWQAGGRDISETDIVLALAAERGVPALFVTGDDVLERDVRGPQYVRTKQALSPRAARSLPATEGCTLIGAAARQAALVAGAPLPADIIVRFKSRWMAERAGPLGQRVGPHAVRVTGTSFFEAYRRASKCLDATAPVLGAALRTTDPELFVDDVTNLLARTFPPERRPTFRDEAARALRWLLGATSGTGSTDRADRALTLHMLEVFAPAFFAEHGLAPVLDESVRALSEMPADFPIGLKPPEAAARLDGLYILSERGTPRPFDADRLRAYVRWLAEAVTPVWAWVLCEQMEQMGLGRPVAVSESAMLKTPRLVQLYYLTHVFLAATRFLRRPLPAGFEPRIEALCLAVPEVLAARRVDLAAEFAFCLQIAHEADTAEHAQLMELVRAHQLPDGRVADPSSEGTHPNDPVEAKRLEAHATAAALLALAGTSR